MSEITCVFCNSSWNTSKVLAECPFCGKTILADDVVGDSVQLDMVGLLSKMRDTYGIDIFAKTSQAISMMKDFAPYLDHEIRLFKLGMEANVYISFLKIKNGELQQIEAINKITTVLVDDYFLNEKSVKTIIEWFMGLFSLSQPSQKDNEGKKIVAQQLVLVLNAIPKKTATLTTLQPEQKTLTPKKTNPLVLKKLYDSKGNCIYDGYVKNNQRSGLGTSFYSNGTKEYDGEWSFDLKSGSGTLYDEKGNIVYSGGWLNGHMAGRGELRTSDGVYVGSFANDKKNGRGIMRYNDGREERQEWYLGERVADENLIRAMNNLYISFDEAFLKENYSVILSLANSGNSDAQFFVGKCYDRGVVVKEDKATAKMWYTKASIKGNSSSTHNIGSILEGQALTDDAIAYFEKALQQGEVLAAWNLGRIYRLRWKINNDINLFLVADAYLAKGIELNKPNRYTTEKMFLKYKYECASMAYRNAKVVAAYYEKKSKFTFKKPNEFTEKMSEFTAKMQRYDKTMKSISSEMLSKYKADVTQIDW